jgi:hypothetical protein
VVIRFRGGYDTGKAGGSRLDSGIWAMLRSIFLATGKWLGTPQDDNDNRFHLLITKHKRTAVVCKLFFSTVAK